MAKVLINGAGRGIGLALVKVYQREGHEVIACCRKIGPELKDLGVQIVEGIDVTDLDSLKVNCEQIPTEIDQVINNAGILISDSLNDLSFDNLRNQYEVNSLGPLRFIRTILPKTTTSAKIGIISSRMGSIADNSSGGKYGYRMSKAATNAMGKSLAIDLASAGRSVFILHPGYVKTEMTHQHGNISPLEAAEGLYKMMQKLEISQTGTFWHMNGDKLPW